MIETTMPAVAPCQVRSNTENPCSSRSVVQIRGVAFCEACACEQEAYFAIGEIVAHEGTQDLRRTPLAQTLAEALGRMRRGRAGGKEDLAA